MHSSYCWICSGHVSKFLCLLLVLVGDVSVTGMTSVVLMIVVVEGDELAVSSSIIICHLDGVVVGEGCQISQRGEWQ